MPQSFKKVALVGKYDNLALAESVERLADFLSGHGYEVILARQTAKTLDQPRYRQASLTELPSVAEAVIVLGGDGTMLSIARALAPYPVPLIGVNQGRLGFLTDITVGNMEAELARMLAGEYDVEERVMLTASLSRGDGTHNEGSAFNDVVVSKAGTGRLIEFEVIIDNEYVYTQRSDGLVVATPTGSTAYALSANGPILHPQVQGIVMVPVAPQALSNRPIVLPDDVTITIRVVEGREPRVAGDMQVFSDLHVGDDIIVQRAPFRCRFLHPPDYTYYATLRGKLNWHELPILQQRKR